MRLQRKLSKSVRMPGILQPSIGNQMVRLSLNPVLYSRSHRVVQWNPKKGGGISPKAVILQAREKYPALSLSAAVEVILIELLEQEAMSNSRAYLSVEEAEQLKRFSRLSLLEKIRLTEKRKRLFWMLSALPWKRDEG